MGFRRSAKGLPHSTSKGILFEQKAWRAQAWQAAAPGAAVQEATVRSIIPGLAPFRAAEAREHQGNRVPGSRQQPFMGQALLPPLETRAIRLAIETETTTVSGQPWNQTQQLSGGRQEPARLVSIPTGPAGEEPGQDPAQAVTLQAQIKLTTDTSSSLS